MSRVTSTEEVGRLLKALDENKSLVHFRKMQEENTELIKEIEELRVANRSNDKKLFRLVDEVEENKKQAKDTAEKLNAVVKQKNDLATKHSDAARQLREATDELVSLRKEVHKLRGFTIELKPTPPTLAQTLDLLFKETRAFAETYFGTEFPEEVLGETDKWGGVRDHEYIKGYMLPIPFSNTLAARQMRVAAVLAILAAEFDAFFFRPTPIVDRSGFSHFLSDLADRDPEREAYIRSAILAALTEDQYETSKKRRVESATERLFKLFSPLFPLDEGLESALRKLCERIYAGWHQIQRLKLKVEAHFHFHVDESDDWLPLSFEKPYLSSPAPKGNPKQQQQNGSGNTGKPRGKNAPETVDPTTDLSGLVIWPSFISASDPPEDAPPLAKGYVLRETQLQAARDEEKALRISGGRRDMRASVRRQRTMSVGGSAEAMTPDGSAPAFPSSSPFLAARAGGGLKAS
ncbi:hypothetical protein OQA88_11209 [Cercophora sp. LCS_1]